MDGRGKDQKGVGGARFRRGGRGEVQKGVGGTTLGGGAQREGLPLVE